MPDSIPYELMECLHTIEDAEDVSRVAISPDGKKFASSSYFPVKVWDTLTGQLIHDLCPDGLAYSLAISFDSQLLAAGCDDVSTTLWNLHTGEKLHIFERCTEFPREVVCVGFTPDRSCLISGWGGRIELWDVELKQPLSISKSVGAGSDFALSQDGQIMVSTYLSMVQVHKFETGARLHYLESPLRYVGCIAISSDGKIFAIGDDDGTIKVFSTITAEELLTFDTHTGFVGSIIFSSDNQTLISCGEDESIYFWNFHTGEKIHTLKGHPRRVRSISLSADGRTLVSCNGRPSLREDMVSTIKVWGIR
jgi:WD40 repeat protein